MGDDAPFGLNAGFPAIRLRIGQIFATLMQIEASTNAGRPGIRFHLGGRRIEASLQR
jgi:hypothetical protein